VKDDIGRKCGVMLDKADLTGEATPILRRKNILIFFHFKRIHLKIKGRG
jgi:hypothetical protein